MMWCVCVKGEICFRLSSFHWTTNSGSSLLSRPRYVSVTSYYPARPASPP